MDYCSCHTTRQPSKTSKHLQALVAPKGAVFYWSSQTSVHLLFLAAQQQLARPRAPEPCDAVKKLFLRLGLNFSAKEMLQLVPKKFNRVEIG